MKRLLIAATLTALASNANAHGWDDESKLQTPQGDIVCEGTRQWRANGRRRFWTEGRMCPLTYEQCLQAYVRDRDGTHKVVACSPDSEWSEGRKADY